MRGGKRDGAGRPKGRTNKVTDELRAKIDLLLSNNWHKLQTDIDQLSPKERLDTILKLLDYSLPRLQRTSLDIEQESPVHKIEIVRTIVSKDITEL